MAEDTAGSVIVEERIYQGDDDLWFYRARGGAIVGPFPTREQAELALAKKMRTWGGAPTPKAVWRSWRPGRIMKNTLLSRRPRSGSRQR